MASPSGVFYAYAKNNQNDKTGRYLITFASRSVADEWWRAVADSVAAGYTRFSKVQRISSQWYTHEPFRDFMKGVITETINDSKCAHKFLGKVFFTLLNDRDGRSLSVMTVLNYTEHTSGSLFFIRSVLQQELYWFSDQGTICASTVQRTKFRICIAGNRKPDRTIMIGSEKVDISVGASNTTLRAANNGLLLDGEDENGSNTGMPFNFSDFDGVFGLRFDDSDPGGIVSVT